MFDFDKVNRRRGTGCVKWDNDRDGVIPMWVADMDSRLRHVSWRRSVSE